MTEEKPKKPRRKGAEPIYDKWAGDTVEMPPHKVHVQPTKYRPEMCDQLVQHMSEGKSFGSFAAVIKVSTSTLEKWVKTHEEFAQAKEKGHAAALLFYEETGVQSLHAGKQFNQNMWMFLMKTRFRNDGYREKYPEDERGVNITQTSLQLNPGDLAELIRVARGEVQKVEAVLLPPSENLGSANPREATAPSPGANSLPPEEAKPEDR